MRARARARNEAQLEAEQMCVLDGKHPICGALIDGGILLGVDDEKVAQRVVDQIETHIRGDDVFLTIVLNKGIEKSPCVECISEPETQKIGLERPSGQRDIIARKGDLGAEMTIGPELSRHLKTGLLAIPKLPIIEVQTSREGPTAVGSKLNALFLILMITRGDEDTASYLEVLIQPFKIKAPSNAESATILEKEIYPKGVFAREKPVVRVGV